MQYMGFFIYQDTGYGRFIVQENLHPLAHNMTAAGLGKTGTGEKCKHNYGFKDRNPRCVC